MAARSAALAGERAAEARKARELIAAFVAEAVARRLPTTALRAQGYGGRARYRTGLTGWYLNQARTVAIGVDGNYYVLGVPRSFLARLVGVRLQPQEPRLTIGVGGPDGESMSLKDLLDKQLL
ncbi:hypothetical protein Rhe02_88450 [Rhizocola hellebori]|uniref:Uncharacterized protein n=2 Tax=Rhizocola hellebori TaxID=1392758 RepID=A0A8J3QJZ7_9ACTN|nr:hypothetical protein [Rhizocola hellebori]GIH10778.1 hypothetical protein Rhe02_88450 [Rhizocola hellebori]